MSNFLCSRQLFSHRPITRPPAANTDCFNFLQKNKNQKRNKNSKAERKITQNWLHICTETSIKRLNESAYNSFNQTSNWHRQMVSVRSIRHLVVLLQLLQSIIFNCCTCYYLYYVTFKYKPRGNRIFWLQFGSTITW